MVQSPIHNVVAFALPVLGRLDHPARDRMATIFEGAQIKGAGVGPLL